MDLKGSLVDTNIKIQPSKNLIEYLKNIPIDDDVPANIGKLIKGANYEVKQKQNKEIKAFTVQLNDEDLNNLKKIKDIVNGTESKDEEQKDDENVEDKVPATDSNEDLSKNDKTEPKKEILDEKKIGKDKNDFYLLTSDIDWLYQYLQNQKSKGVKEVPYLHQLLEGSVIDMPENEILKRNPVLEARCVKLRAQQEAREYRKMTKSVDNVRMKFPEDSISYQLKQVNRHMIAIGQFILSIFAGFLFGFKGVEWMIGSLDFGFRLLLGVICALVISLAEIYFLAKKLNEELNIPETVQLGGPAKFVDQPTPYYAPKSPSKEVSKTALDKEHQD